MPSTTLVPFLFTLPDKIPLMMSNEIRALDALPTSSRLFMDMLEHIINSKEDILLIESDRLLLKACLTTPWTISNKEMNPLLLKKTYELGFENLVQAQRIINILLWLRNQAIIAAEKTDLTTETDQMAFLKDTQDRFRLMTNIFYAIGDNVFSKEFSPCNPVVTSIFYDMKSVMKNISEGFYAQHFTSSHTMLMSCFLEAEKKTQSLRTDIFPKIKQTNEFLVTTILSCLIPFSLHKVMYLFSVGDDHLAEAQALKPTEGQALSEAFYKERPMLNVLYSEILAKQALLSKEVQQDTKRRTYAAILFKMKKYFMTDFCVIQLSTQAELYDQLYEFDQALQKTVELNLYSFKLIHETLLLIHLTHRKNYYDSSAILEISKKLLLKTQDIILKNPGNVIAFKINKYLQTYLKVIEKQNFKTIVAQKPEMLTHEIKKEPVESLPTEKGNLALLKAQEEALASAITQCELEISTIKKANEAIQNEQQHALQEALQEEQVLIQEVAELEKSQALEMQAMHSNRDEIQALQNQIKEAQKKQVEQDKKQAKIIKQIAALKQENKTLKQSQSIPLPSDEDTLKKAIQTDQLKIETLKAALKLAMATKTKIESDIQALETLNATEAVCLNSEITQFEQTIQGKKLENNTLYEKIKVLKTTLQKVYQDQHTVDATNLDIYDNRLKMAACLYVQPLQHLLPLHPSPAPILTHPPGESKMVPVKHFGRQPKKHTT